MYGLTALSSSFFFFFFAQNNEVIHWRKKNGVCPTLCLIIVQILFSSSFLFTLYYPILCFTHPSNLLHISSVQQVSGSKSLLASAAKTNTSAHWGILKVKAGFLWGQWRALHAWVCTCRGKSEHRKRALVFPCTFLKGVRSRLKPSPPTLLRPVQMFLPSATPQSMREDFYTWNVCTETRGFMGEYTCRSIPVKTFIICFRNANNINRI